jgi:putative Holliday junction resolvase
VTALKTTGLDGNALQVCLDAMRRLDADDPFDAIVMGLPLRLDGSPNAMTPRVKKFAERLGERTGLIVFLQDERLTSVDAESLLAERDRDWRSRKSRLDAAAAALILQDYLDARAARPGGRGLPAS